MFNIYIKKAADIYGVPKTRQIYEKAIEVLNDENTREMCLRFAEMETKLGEVDRARAIYAHCSQICDPRVCAHYNKFQNSLLDYIIHFSRIKLKLYRLRPTFGKFGKNLKSDMEMKIQCVKCFESSVACKLCITLK